MKKGSSAAEASEQVKGSLGSSCVDYDGAKDAIGLFFVAIRALMSTKLVWVMMLPFAPRAKTIAMLTVATTMVMGTIVV